MIWCLKFKGQDCLPRGWSHVTTCIWRLVPLSSLERRRSWSSSPSGSCPQCGRAAFCQQSGIRSSQEDNLELNQPESCEAACREASDTSYTPEVERRGDPLIETWSWTDPLSVLSCSSHHYLLWTLQSEEPAEHSAVKPWGHGEWEERGELYT